jgi:hypothetical protein
MQRCGTLARGSLFVLFAILMDAVDTLPQATWTASKSGSISFFGMYTRGDTDRSDVSGETHINNGTTFGADYTRYFHWIVTPSLELRTKFLPGGTLGQKLFGGGLPLEHRWGNFAPYANFFMGYGRFERWYIGRYNGFVPQAFSIGVLYRIPFKPYVGDLR